MSRGMLMDAPGPSGPATVKQVDARGLNCPLPILRAKKALSGLQSGDVLRVLATDPGSIRDFQAFARQTGNLLLRQETLADGVIEHDLQRR